MINLTLLDQKLLILSAEVGLPVYDFDFSLYFACSHPYQIDGELPCVIRTGAIDDYASEYATQLARGIRLINSPEQHERASELIHWYPRLQALTPRTMVFETLPTVTEIETHFNWPVFMKGSRQTAKHALDLSVIRSAAQYEVAANKYKTNPILHWQKPVIREFAPLMPVAGGIPGQITPSLEFRSFWWQGECVGCGRYWYQTPHYSCADLADGLAVAKQAAQLMQVPFLVVDFAKTLAGNWIVIECNDAQEAGYADVVPRNLWQAILEKMA
ncbi:MAG: hypothetical protein RL748_4351 [Pseudomonadota bacterium]|jgi:hypothetical protein